MHALTRLRFPALILAAALIAGSCGSDADPEETSTTTTPTTTVDSSAEIDGDSTTTTATGAATTTTTTSDTPDSPSGELASGSVTTAQGLASEWTLSGDSSELCFRADLTHPDPETQADAGDGTDDCIAPDGGISDMDDQLSVDVGTVDGTKTIGYLWGRVGPDVLVLSIIHDDDSHTDIELIPGPDGQRVFAFVAEIDTMKPVIALDALSGTRLEDSEPIRDFLRVGPSYPVTEPTVATTPVYPTVN